MVKREIPPRIAEPIVSKEIESKKVLLDLDSGDYYTLNEAGSFIFGLCDGKRTLSDIAAALAEAFDVSFDEALGDATALIEELRREGIIEADDRPK